MATSVGYVCDWCRGQRTVLDSLRAGDMDWAVVGCSRRVQQGNKAKERKKVVVSKQTAGFGRADFSGDRISDGPGVKAAVTSSVKLAYKCV